MLVATCCLWAARGYAQPSRTDRVTAQALFDDGRQLMQAQRFREACPKFEASQRLDPGIGTQFNLGDCYEQLGRLASAWIQFVDVAAAARGLGQPTRERIARERAAKLAPRLARLRITEAERTPGLVIERAGSPVPQAHWGTAFPVDSGRYLIEAHAAGYKPVRSWANVKREGETISVSIPFLQQVEIAEPSCDAACHSQQVRTVSAVVLAGVGAAGIAVGAVYGAVAIGKKDEAAAHCPEEGKCFDAGIALRNEARDAANVSTVAITVGGAAMVSALVLWLTTEPWSTEPNRSEQAISVFPRFGGDEVGVGMSATF